MSRDKHHDHSLSAAGLLITLGIIYGDIGTSPLYVMKAIAGSGPISRDLILGGVSCVIWTLTLQTTIKYVIITLRADNKGEGGIFSLFALVRRRLPKLYLPAIIGGSALLADGIITPPISVSSAIEGLKSVEYIKIHYPDLQTIPIVIGIITMIFLLQGFGTKIMGRAFGPIMFVWFMMLGILGILQIGNDLSIFNALNPYYAIHLLTDYPQGFWLLGAVFLCTTGAEALYSDLGHCGLQNIRISWIFVKACLLLNYLGQGAWILQYEGKSIAGSNPFFTIMPEWFLPYGIAIATLAAIIASQALISGSYTLISEALRLDFWPKVKINYPSVSKGQLYVPSINWMLLAGCIAVVLYFGESSNMEAAYGLAISLTMLMTTILLFYYLTYVKKLSYFISSIILILYITIELAFLIANLKKFVHGGYVTLIISGVLITVMYVWFTSKKVKNSLVEYVKLEDYYPLLNELSSDLSIPKYATHLVYLTGAYNPKQVESKIIYSIFQKQPKRADIYWFVHIDVTDDPYTMQYKAEVLVANDVVRVNFKLGFRIEQKINLYFRKVVEDMVAKKELDFTSRYTSLNKHNIIGDFRFVVLEKHLSNDNDLPPWKRFLMQGHFLLKNLSLSEKSAFGLDTSSVTVEQVPLVITTKENIKLERIY